jgi:hypothetical protein
MARALAPVDLTAPPPARARTDSVVVDIAAAPAQAPPPARARTDSVVVDIAAVPAQARASSRTVRVGPTRARGQSKTSLDVAQVVSHSCVAPINPQCSNPNPMDYANSDSDLEAIRQKIVRRQKRCAEEINDSGNGSSDDDSIHVTSAPSNKGEISKNVYQIYPGENVTEHCIRT